MQKPEYEGFILLYYHLVEFMLIYCNAAGTVFKFCHILKAG